MNTLEFVQNFEEDYYESDQEYEQVEKQRPQIYRDYQTVHDQLDFQTTYHHQPIWVADEPIVFKNTLTRARTPNSTKKGFNGTQKSQSRSRSRSKSYGRPKTAKPAIIVQKKAKRNGSKPKTAVSRSTNMRGKENESKTVNVDPNAQKKEGGWNNDTRTTGWFDPKLKKQLIINSKTDRQERLEAEKLKTTGSTKKNFVTTQANSPTHFTDLDNFHQFVEENPKKEKKGKPKLPAKEKKVVAPRTPVQKKRDVTPDKKVQNFIQEHIEENDGKANPMFLRMAKTLVKEATAKPTFFPGRHIEKDKPIENEKLKAKKKNNKFAHLRPKFLDYEEEHKQLKRRKSDENINPRTGSQDAHANRSKSPQIQNYQSLNPVSARFQEAPDADFYPTKENGRPNIKDIVEFKQKQHESAKKSGKKTKKATINPEEMFKNATKQALNQQYQEEIARQIRLDNAVSDYEHHIKKRMEDPNTYLAAVHEGLENVKKNLVPLIEDLNRTAKFLKKDTPYNSIVARGAGKLVQIHSSQVSELIIDDLIYEAVYVLNEKETREQEKRKKIMQKSILNDALEALRDLTFEQRKIKENVEEADILQALTSHKIQEIDPKKRIPAEDKPRVVEFNIGQIANLLNNQEKYLKFKRNDKLLNDHKRIMIDAITDDFMKEMLDKLTEDMWNLESEYVEGVFENEFEV